VRVVLTADEARIAVRLIVLVDRPARQPDVIMVCLVYPNVQSVQHFLRRRRADGDDRLAALDGARRALCLLGCLGARARARLRPRRRGLSIPPPHCARRDEPKEHDDREDEAEGVESSELHFDN